MNQTNYILFEGRDAKACMLALRDTFGPSFAEEALLLFTDEGRRGQWIARAGILALEVPEHAQGPYRAIIKARDSESALNRLGLMADPMHNYGEPPRLIDEAELNKYLKR